MSIFAELKRRNVFRVGIAYAVVAWLVLQVADVMIDNLEAPDWLFGSILLVLGIGFPIALIFAWAFELTPEGLKREHEVDRSQSITPKTGRRLDIVIIGVLAVALAYFIYESRFKGDSPVTEDTTAEVTSPGTETASAAPGPVTTPDNLSIAVLPFANRSRVEDDEFFVEGMHDDLLTQLAKIGDLKVVSRTTAMKYQDTTLSIPEIAAELGVGIILEGGVQRAGDRVRINAQLINAEDEHLWAETYDREMTVENIFDIQSEITRQIVVAVRGELTVEESTALAALPTESIEAYEAFLKARSLVDGSEYNLEVFREALPWNERALELDPGFASAWAQQVEIRSQMAWLGIDDSPEQLAALQHAMDQASRFGIGNADVIMAQAAIYYRVDNDYAASAAALESALNQLPGDARLWTEQAFSQRRMGDYDGAIASIEKSLALDPDQPQSRRAMLKTLWFARRYEEAKTLARRWIEQDPDAAAYRQILIDILVRVDGDMAQAEHELAQMDADGGQSYAGSLFLISWARQDYDRLLAHREDPAVADFVGDPVFLAISQLNNGEIHLLNGNRAHGLSLIEQSIALFENNPSKIPNRLSSELVNMARAHTHLGNHDQALALLAEARTVHPPELAVLDWAEMVYYEAWVMARAGQVDEALALLETGLARPGDFTQRDLRVDQVWDFMRDDPRFVALTTPNNLEIAE